MTAVLGRIVVPAVPDAVGTATQVQRRRTSRLSTFAVAWIALVIFFLPSEAAASSASTTSNKNLPFVAPSAGGAAAGHEILEEKVVYNRWRCLIQRVVRMPNGKVVDYDIVDQKGAGAVIIFAWDSKTKTATIVREYNPGCHRVLGGPAAGIIETCPTKHDSDALLAARHELEEECHLGGGTWYRLTDEGVSVPMDKYVVTEITAYLVIDPKPVEDPRPLDAEEDIEIVGGITVEDVLRMVREGDMNLVGGWASLLAIEKLRELGEI